MAAIDRYIKRNIEALERSAVPRVFVDQHPDAVRAIDDRNVLVDFIATTDRVALDGMVFVPTGAKHDPDDPENPDTNSYFFTNRCLLHNHDGGDARQTVGKLRSKAIVHLPDGTRAWRISAQLLDLDSAVIPRADVLKLADAGLLKWSVGIRDMQTRGFNAEADPARYRSASAVVDLYDWHETSMTTMPVDVACATEGVQINERSAAKLCGALCDGTIDRKLADALGIDRPSAAIVIE